MKLKKYEANPILSPLATNSWENLVTCNPAAWYEEGKFYLYYRAAGNDYNHTIQLGLAVSEDGYVFERVSDNPFMAYIPNNFDGGLEDPRICKIEDAYYLTYAYRPFLPGQYWIRKTKPVIDMNCPSTAPVFYTDNISATALAISKDPFDFKRMGRITSPNVDNRDVILFPEKINGQYVRLERPMSYFGSEYGCDGPSTWLNFSDNILEWDDTNLHLLIKPEKDTWYSQKTGGSTPPLKTEEGWLLIYHGVGEDGIYRTGVMLLDLDNPKKIISKSKDFIMEPEHDYELGGFYNGCVFPTGNVIVEDTLYVYYGASDKYCCVATCSVTALLQFLKREL